MERLIDIARRVETDADLLHLLREMQRALGPIEVEEQPYPPVLTTKSIHELGSMARGAVSAGDFLALRLDILRNVAPALPIIIVHEINQSWDVQRENAGWTLILHCRSKGASPLSVEITSHEGEDGVPFTDHKALRSLIDSGRIRVTIEALPRDSGAI